MLFMFILSYVRQFEIRQSQLAEAAWPWGVYEFRILECKIEFGPNDSLSIFLSSNEVFVTYLKMNMIHVFDGSLRTPKA